MRSRCQGAVPTGCLLGTKVTARLFASANASNASGTTTNASPGMSYNPWGVAPRLLLALLAHHATGPYSGHLAPDPVVGMSISLLELLDTLMQVRSTTDARSSSPSQSSCARRIQLDALTRVSNRPRSGPRAVSGDDALVFLEVARRAPLHLQTPILLDFHRRFAERCSSGFHFGIHHP